MSRQPSAWKFTVSMACAAKARRVSGATSASYSARKSCCQPVMDASISLSSVTSWDALGRTDAVLDLARDCWRQRAYGDFWSYCLVAEGAVDVAVVLQAEIAGGTVPGRGESLPRQGELL